MNRRFRDMGRRAFGGASRSRRQVLGATAKGALGGAGALLISRAIGLGVLDGEPLPARAQGAVVRRNLHTLGEGDTTLADYARAVGQMQEWNEDITPDPADSERVKNWRRSWLYQAFIHGMPAEAEDALIAELGGNPTDDEYAAALGERGWRTCEHHTDFFWPWHRMYLYWFERIIRELSGNPNWALPYWDYLDVEQRVLPEPFWKDPANPLFVIGRDPLLNRGEIPNLSAALENAVFGNICAGLSQNVYSLAADRLETTPHDFVHGWVGGGVAGLVGTMSSITTSAQDPLFWLHHVNLDRLWQSWRSLGGADPTTTDWRENKSNTEVLSPLHEEPVLLTVPYAFVNEMGDMATSIFVVHEVLDTTALGYTYEELFVPFAPIADICSPAPLAPLGADAATPAAVSHEPVEVGRAQLDAPIDVGSEPVAIPVMLEPAADMEGAAAQAQNVVVTVEGIEGGGVPGTFFEVYLNLPEGTAPDFRSLYFVGNISLFGLQPWDNGGGHGGHMGGRQFNISPNIAALEARGEWTGDVTITVVPYYSSAPEVGDVLAGTPAADATPAALLPEGPWVTIGDVSIATQ